MAPGLPSDEEAASSQGDDIGSRLSVLLPSVYLELAAELGSVGLEALAENSPVMPVLTE